MHRQVYHTSSYRVSSVASVTWPPSPTYKNSIHISEGISTRAVTSGSLDGAMDRLRLLALLAKRLAVGATDDLKEKLVGATAKTVVGIDNLQRRQ